MFGNIRSNDNTSIILEFYLLFIPPMAVALGSPKG